MCVKPKLVLIPILVQLKLSSIVMWFSYIYHLLLVMTPCSEIQHFFVFKVYTVYFAERLSKMHQHQEISVETSVYNTLKNNIIFCFNGMFLK